MQDLTFDAALNPGVHRSRADQIILNLSTNETFLPEKRPLFLESADTLSTALGRMPCGSGRQRRSRIDSSTPGGSAARRARPRSPTRRPFQTSLRPPPSMARRKLTGRPVGRGSTVGALAAVTGENLVTVRDSTTRPSIGAGSSPPDDRAAVLRLRQDINTGYFGAMATSTSRFENLSSHPDSAPPFAPTAVPRQRPDGVFTTRMWPRSMPACVFGDRRYTAAGQPPRLADSARGARTHRARWDGDRPGRSGPGGMGAFWPRRGDSTSPGNVDYARHGRRGRLQRPWLHGAAENLEELRAGSELRFLQPGRLTLERRTQVQILARRNLDGLGLGYRLDLSHSVLLQSFWRLTAGLGGSPARFDDRENRR